jgi:hypothetical protein
MATIAARLSMPTAGYDCAFWISAAAMVIAATLARALPGKPKPQRYVTSREEIAEPTALVEAQPGSTGCDLAAGG